MRIVVALALLLVAWAVPAAESQPAAAPVFDRDWSWSLSDTNFAPPIHPSTWTGSGVEIREDGTARILPDTAARAAKLWTKAPINIPPGRYTMSADFRALKGASGKMRFQCRVGPKAQEVGVASSDQDTVVVSTAHLVNFGATPCILELSEYQGAAGEWIVSSPSIRRHDDPPTPLRVDPTRPGVRPAAPPGVYPLGVYDTSGYWVGAAGWTKYLNTVLRDLPIDVYLNYHLGHPNMPMTAWSSLGEALAARANPAQAIVAVTGHYQGGVINTDYLDRVSAVMNGHRGFWGWYIADERPDSWLFLMRRMQAEIEKRSDHPTLAVYSHGSLGMVRSIADVIATDPYPLRKVGALPLTHVADLTQASLDAVAGTRPAWTVLQLFGDADGFVWPSPTELRVMSWLAVVQGADGLVYWSLGTKGIQWLRKRDPAKAEALFQGLRTTMLEIKVQQAILTTPKVPAPPHLVQPGEITRAHRTATETVVYAIQRDAPYTLTIRREPLTPAVTRQIRVWPRSPAPVTVTPSGGGWLFEGPDLRLELEEVAR